MLVRHLYGVGLRGADCIFFQNRDDQGHFVKERIVDQARTALLPGSGVDLKRFLPNRREDDGRVVFLLVARLLKAKGIAEFVEAATVLRKRYGDRVEFRLLGIRDSSPGGIDSATLDRWHKEGAITLMDAVSDVRPALERADCVVLPSYYPEGTPRSLLEAAASGKAIITTDMPGCRDVIEPGGNGFLCLPRDVPSLIEALERYLLLAPSQRLIMGERSRQKAVCEFDERIVIDAYLQKLTAVVVK